MTRPACYNRPPRDAGRWILTGRKLDGRFVFRWFPRWYEDRCATHDGAGIGPNGENYAVANGYDCDGCRWDPRVSAGEKVGLSPADTSKFERLCRAPTIQELIDLKFLCHPSIPPGSYAVFHGGKVVMSGLIDGLKSKPAPAPSHFYRRFMESE